MTGRAQEIVSAIKEQLGIPNVIAEFKDGDTTITVHVAVHANQFRVYGVKGIDASTAQCLIEEFETLALEEHCNVIWRVNDPEIIWALMNNQYTRFPSPNPTLCKSHINILRNRAKVPA